MLPDRVRRVLLGLLPLWILLFGLVVFPGFMQPIFANPPAMVGLPLGVVLVGAALVVMAIGVVVLHRALSQRLALLAFVGLTMPSAVVMAVAPALVLSVLDMTWSVG